VNDNYLVRYLSTLLYKGIQ